ncbi:hypothetical protein SmJEL517_g01815 [Synchytrium microbalum]|uniref:Cytochrome b561 domain-containing protein n=1 Tax=Synchytrium microbalum TaxID=1806994 RepID=A0A507CEN0_9FUNG|nr:uncharacterized protein SmJEL517_g01815 [Synchytrium microbalum]TPX35973.1 hypothetical protein SmJEL517_g01815 [Synchytrium microbalum]
MQTFNLLSFVLVLGVSFVRSVTITGSSFTLESAVNGSQAQFTFTGQTSQWIGFGVGSSMSQADMIIVWCTSTTCVAGRRYSQGEIIPTYFTTQNLVVQSESVTGPTFRIVVQRPMAALQTHEMALSSGSNSYIYAVGGSPNVATASATFNQHNPNDQNSFNADLFPSASSTGNSTAITVAGSTVNYTLLIQAHGGIMAAVWVVITPLAILIARNFKAQLGIWWFRLHASLALIIMVGTVVGLPIAYYAHSVTSTPHFSFSDNGIHVVLGLAIIVGVVVQFALGIVINALFNPQRKSVPLTDKLHWFLGRLLTLAAVVNIWFGLSLYAQKQSLSVALYAIYGVWLAILLVLIIAIQFRYPVVHHLKGKIGDKIMEGEEEEQNVAVAAKRKVENE